MDNSLSHTHIIFLLSHSLSLTLLFFVLYNEETKKLFTQVIQINCTNNITLKIVLTPSNRTNKYVHDTTPSISLAL
jgi:hypothetical protein